MIFSDQYRFAFVHIPKCAGTSVRLKLSRFNDWKLAGPPWLKSHDKMGSLDFAHIPLFVLREHFPEEYEVITRYWSFAVMRDPLDRFASSVSQRLKMYSDQPIHQRSLDEVRRSVDQIIDFLCRQPQGHLLPPEYIHFQKQVDYIELDGIQILDKVYCLSEMHVLLEDVGRRVGQTLVESREKRNVEHTNRTVVFRNDALGRVIDRARPLADYVGKLLPEVVKQRIREAVYVPRDSKLKNIFATEEIRDFIHDYYSDDVELYHRVAITQQSEAS